jgi:hypothetical protein
MAALSGGLRCATDPRALAQNMRDGSRNVVRVAKCCWRWLDKRMYIALRRQCPLLSQPMPPRRAVKHKASRVYQPEEHGSAVAVDRECV